MMKNVFYWPNINCIGGVETFLFEMAKKYGKTYDLTLYYKVGDKAQIDRYRKLMRVKQYHGEKIKCEKVFFGWGTDIIDNIEAKEYYQTLHADYKAQNLQPCGDPRITAYLGVSQAVCDVFTETFGLPAELCYNPLTIEKPKKMLRLVSATRLTWEKGAKRISQLADALDAKGIPYTWEIFTNSSTAAVQTNSKNLVFRNIRLDIRNYIADSDYLVQLSDTEAYSYSIIEALALGTPVIVTPWPCLKDLGVVNGVNAFVLPFDMNDIPVDAIYKGLKKFKYEIRQDRYNEYFAPGKSNYEKEKLEPVKIRCTHVYYDIMLQKQQNPGDEQIVTRERAEMLCELGVIEFAEG